MVSHNYTLVNNALVLVISISLYVFVNMSSSGNLHINYIVAINLG